MIKPDYYIAQQMRLFPPKCSPVDCNHCGRTTIHFIDYKDRLVCNECGWFELPTDYRGVEVKIR